MRAFNLRFIWFIAFYFSKLSELYVLYMCNNLLYINNINLQSNIISDSVLLLLPVCTKEIVQNNFRKKLVVGAKLIRERISRLKTDFIVQLILTHEHKNSNVISIRAEPCKPHYFHSCVLRKHYTRSLIFHKTQFLDNFTDDSCRLLSYKDTTERLVYFFSSTHTHTNNRFFIDGWVKLITTPPIYYAIISINSPTHQKNLFNRVVFII